MSTIAADGKLNRMFVKGAPEKLLDKCSKFSQLGIEEAPMTDSFK